MRFWIKRMQALVERIQKVSTKLTPRNDAVRLFFYFRPCQAFSRMWAGFRWFNAVSSFDRKYNSSSLLLLSWRSWLLPNITRSAACHGGDGWGEWRLHRKRKALVSEFWSEVPSVVSLLFCRCLLFCRIVSIRHGLSGWGHNALLKRFALDAYFLCHCEVSKDLPTC